MASSRNRRWRQQQSETPCPARSASPLCSACVSMTLRRATPALCRAHAPPVRVGDPSVAPRSLRAGGTPPLRYGLLRLRAVAPPTSPPSVNPHLGSGLPAERGRRTLRRPWAGSRRLGDLTPRYARGRVTTPRWGCAPHYCPKVVRSGHTRKGTLRPSSPRSAAAPGGPCVRVLHACFAGTQWGAVARLHALVRVVVATRFRKREGVDLMVKTYKYIVKKETYL